VALGQNAFLHYGRLFRLFPYHYDKALTSLAQLADLRAWALECGALRAQVQSDARVQGD